MAQTHTVQIIQEEKQYSAHSFAI